MYGREDLIVWKADLTGNPYGEAKVYVKEDADNYTSKASTHSGWRGLKGLKMRR